MARWYKETLLAASLRRAALSSVSKAWAQGRIDEREAVTEEIGFALEAAAEDAFTIAGTAALGTLQTPERGGAYGESTEGIEQQYDAGMLTRLEMQARIQAVRTPAVEAVALAVSPEDFVRESRKRVRRVFTFHLSVTIALSVLLIGAITAAFVLFILGDTRSAVAFGGISLAELIGTVVYQPLNKCHAALLASQTLEFLILQMWEQIETCKQQDDIRERIRCMNTTWRQLHATLRAMPV